MNKVDVLLGLQWGDEGKGKVVDVLTPHYDVIARFQGGPNAGHTLIFNGTKHVLHIIPSGIFHKEKKNLIGNGVLIDPLIFEKEIKALSERDVDATLNLFVSQKAHFILPSHRLLDAANEKAKQNQKIGSTLKGIGPAYTDKVARVGLRVGDILEDNFKEKYEALKKSHLQTVQSLGSSIEDFPMADITFADYEKNWFASLETLKKFNIIDSEYFINDCLAEGKTILAEGAQGTMLDIDFGSYPFVTSSNTITAGVCSGLGVAPSKIGKVIGITKAYCTRVGSGPFPTELFDETGDALRKAGNEFGSTTGRPRRCGWIDLPALKYAIMLNGVTDLFVTKVDVLNDLEQINLCTQYSINGKQTDQIPYSYNTTDLKPVYEVLQGWKTDLAGIESYEALPEKVKAFMDTLEKHLSVPVKSVSISPDRKDIVFKN